MPQSIALIGEFTVSNALYYFGRINGLNEKEIEARREFFSDLLQLPSENYLVKNTSGGQQRRVSFAAALIHRPELLILDEPTVGLDPILRENIWNYLIKITQEEAITVLITTHYIDETKDANKIGLMSKGKLLAESTPQKLLERCQCLSLEEAFLKLCKEESNEAISNEAAGSRTEDTIGNVLNQNQDAYRERKKTSENRVVSKYQVSRLKRFNALLTKNSIQFLRYYTGLTFAIALPIVQIFSFIMAVGNDPRDLAIGIVNDEIGRCDHGKNLTNIWSDEVTCHFANLSCKFLQSFEDFLPLQEYYDSVLDASYDVQNGKLRGIIHFNQNFSKALQKRLEKSKNTKDSDLLASQFNVFLDMSDRPIALYLQKRMFDHFINTYENIMRDCKYSPKLTDPPIRFEEPIYGTTDLNFKDYMMPTFILSLIFLLANAISTPLIITERLEGVWERSIVQGVKTEEILLSHVIIQTVVIVIHTAVTTITFFFIWNLECKGSIFEAIVLIFLNGFDGLMYGFVISIMVDNHSLANYCSLGGFLPLILLNGCIWPLEGMPKALRWLSYVLPTTYSSISLRAIIYQGLSISNSQVYNGYLISIGWILLYFIITILGIRYKSL
ncbi:hypothetical protein PUN28_014028 [Cardiocondyla obscurior]